MHPYILKLARMNLGDFPEYMLVRGEAYAPAGFEAATDRKISLSVAAHNSCFGNYKGEKGILRPDTGQRKPCAMTRENDNNRSWENRRDPLQPSPEEELISREEADADPVQSDENDEETPDAPEEFPPDLYARLIAKFGKACDAWARHRSGKPNYAGAGLNSYETIATLLELMNFSRPEIMQILGQDRAYVRKQFSRAEAKRKARDKRLDQKADAKRRGQNP